MSFPVGSRAQLAPVWRHYGIVPLGATPSEAAAAAVTYDRLSGRGSPRPEDRSCRGRQTAGATCGARRLPSPSDERFLGRPRHAAGEDFEHSAYVMLIDEHGRQRVG